MPLTAGPSRGWKVRISTVPQFGRVCWVQRKCPGAPRHPHGPGLRVPSRKASYWRADFLRRVRVVGAAPFAAAHPGRRVWIIGGPIWPGRSECEYPACAAHEALINAVFADRDAAILCPYDVAGLDGTAVRDAWRTHPVMVDDGARRSSEDYIDPLVTAAGFNLPLPPGAASMEYDSELRLAAVRRFLRGHARGVLDADRADDLVLAADELTANTIEHSAGGGRITIWTEPGRLACQIDDGGHLRDPLAGRIVPLPRTAGGRGLILANQLCDLVRIHTTSDGTSIRLHMAC
ncbi:sensor histidine kinase [Actinoplanes sp. NPDC026623]|uniref:sensor histidine kinase n=1 Tax=Actinoplanes sp. NPDC026623 TaxID=3155610 RepID=UPI0033DB069C